MNIESIRALSGPNLWSDQSVLEAVVVLDARAPEGFGPAALSRLCASLPSDLGAALRRDFVAADAPASWAGLLGRLVVGLQAAAGCQVGFWMARPLKQGVEYRIAAEYAEEPTARRALELALELVRAARDAQPIELESKLVALRKLKRRRALGAEHRLHRTRRSGTKDSGASLEREASCSLGKAPANVGFGPPKPIARAPSPSRIAQDKELTKSLLDAVGIPVPKGVPASSAEAAWAAAQEIGLPVVVKPRSGNQGRGVSVRLRSREAVISAFEIAFAADGEVIVERHIEGADFRMLVIGGRLVAAARREPPAGDRGWSEHDRRARCHGESRSASR